MGSNGATGARRAGFGRGQKAMALIPLAVLSAAWTASIATTGAGTALADATADPTLPDGTSLPTTAVEAPASVSATTASGSPGVVRDADQVVATVSTSGIPAVALAAYQRAETVINAADPGCHLTWQLIAAIGRVESDHGRAGGNTLDAQGVARPGIFGPPLTGAVGTSRITDTDAGRYDDDPVWDRAVGPMQFIPSTWSVVGVDADGDGERNPQDIDDAALGAAVYLCSGNEDLGATAGQRAAVYRYNHSHSYVDLVLSVMQAYLDGEFTSVPNGVSSAGYLVPQSPPGADVGAAGHHGHRSGEAGRPAKGTHTGGDRGDKGGKGHRGDPTRPTRQPPRQSTPAPSDPPASSPAGPTSPVDPPTRPLPTLPTRPATLEPVDQLLTVAQAQAQCQLEGYRNDPGREDDAYDHCVRAYTR